MPLTRDDLKLDSRRGNRHQSAGITAREAETLFRSYEKIRKIASKENLYRGFETKLLDIALDIEMFLVEADRA